MEEFNWAPHNEILAKRLTKCVRPNMLPIENLALIALSGTKPIVKACISYSYVQVRQYHLLVQKNLYLFRRPPTEVAQESIRFSPGILVLLIFS